MSLNFIFKHTDKQPKGAVILFHGLTGSPFELKKYGQFLYNSGYDVYAESLPGHGDKFDEIYTITYKDWLNFSYQKFEELEKQYENVFVSGLCLGAVLAVQLGVKYGSRLRGIISLSTTLFLDGWRLPWYSFLMPLALATLVRYYYNYPECDPHGIKCEKTRNVVKKLLEKGDVGMNDFPMTAIYELIKLSKYVRAKGNLEKVTSPVLLIHALEDDLTSKKSAELVYNRISSDKKKLIILNDSYHMVLYDNKKETVYQNSLEFLDGCRVGASDKELVCI